MERVLFGIICIFSVVILQIFDYVLSENEKERIETDEEYARKKTDESIRLKPFRIFYSISWLTLCAAIAIIWYGFNLIRYNPRLSNILLAFLFIYGGLGGLIVKMVILKIPVSSNSKLGCIFNIILLGCGVYVLVSEFIF